MKAISSAAGGLSRFALLVGSVCLALSGCARGSTGGGGWTEDRLAELEQRVKGLEAEVAALRGGRSRGAANRERTLPIPEQPIALAGLPVLGTASKWVLIEFSDFQCPFCRRHYDQTFPQLEREYVKTGRIRYAFHHLPVDSLHPTAIRGAEAAVCAQTQGKFWEMHGRLFQNSRDMTPQALKAHANSLGLDVASFEKCLQEDGRSQAAKQVAAADRLGLTGTPAFMLGELRPDGSVQILRRIQGAQPFEVFKRTIDQMLTGT